MCKVSSKSVRSHFPNLSKNPRFSLTTAHKMQDPVGDVPRDHLTELVRYPEPISPKRLKIITEATFLYTFTISAKFRHYNHLTQKYVKSLLLIVSFTEASD